MQTKSDKPRKLADHLWKPGQSGNPGGLTRVHRETRARVRAALDDAFQQKGTDGLVDAIVAGVHVMDSTCLKLACAYRWGKPSENPDEEEMTRLRLSAQGLSKEEVVHKLEEALKRLRGLE